MSGRRSPTNGTSRVQQQFANNTTLQVGYVGQRTTHLMVPMPYLQEELLPNGTVSPSDYLAGNPDAAERDRPDLRYRVEWQPELQRSSGYVC